MDQGEALKAIHETKCACADPEDCICSVTVAAAIGSYAQNMDDKYEALCKMALLLIEISDKLTPSELRETWVEVCGDYHSFDLLGEDEEEDEEEEG